MALMNLQVVTPMGDKVTTDVSMVTAPGTMGDLGVLPGHRPLITSLGIGVFSYVPEGGEKTYLAINGGFLEVADDKVIVITETAETPEEIDIPRAETALKRAEKKLAELVGEGDKERRQFALQDKKRAENRIALTKLKKFVPPPV